MTARAACSFSIRAKIFANVNLASVKSVATIPLRRKLHAVLTSGREIETRVLQAVDARVGHVIEIRAAGRALLARLATGLRVRHSARAVLLGARIVVSLRESSRA